MAGRYQRPPTRPAYMSWSKESHEALLLAMANIMKPDRKQYDAILLELEDLGYKCSYDSLRQHLAKLRKKAPAAGGENKATAASASGTKKSRAPAKTGGKRKANQNDADADGNDDGEGTPAPAPKKRGRKPKVEPKVELKDPSNVPSYTDWQPVPQGMDMTPEEYNALAPNPLAGSDEA